jgi:hypothetical protein
VKWQLKVLVVTHLPCQRRRIGRHNAANFIREVHRNGREDVMPRAATDEEFGDGAMDGVVAPVPARRPADYLELVIVTVPDDIAARIGQPLHDVQVTGGRRPMHSVCIVALLARVHVQAALEQQVHHAEVAVVSGDVQQRPCVRLVTRLELVRVRVQQSRQRADVAIARGFEQLAVHRQRIDVRLFAAGTSPFMPPVVRSWGEELKVM